MEEMTLNELRTIIREAHEASLDEGMISNMMDHQNQRAVDQMNGSSGWKARNGITLKNAGAGVAAGLVNAYADPNKLLNKAADMANNAKDGAERARFEREQKKAKMDAYRELQKLQQVKQQIDTKQMQEAAIFVGDNIHGSNVDTYTNANGKSFRIATDTRSKSQKIEDKVTGGIKSAGSYLVQQGIDAGLSKLSNVAGYGVAKAKYAIQDMKEAQKLKKAAKAAKDQLKLQAKHDQEMKKLQANQQSQII